MNPIAQAVELERRITRPALRLPRLPVDPLGVLGLLAIFVAWWGVTEIGWASRCFCRRLAESSM